MCRSIVPALFGGLILPCAASAQDRLFFQGPFGPGGTYNLYELRGAGTRTADGSFRSGRYVVSGLDNVTFETGVPMTMRDADASASMTTEPISGTNRAAHLAAFSGPFAMLENDTATTILRIAGANAIIGLTDDEYFGGGESRTAPPTGSNPALNLENGCGGPDCTATQLAGFAGQTGDAVNDGVGWQWTNGEPYDFKVWNTLGEPNDYASGQGNVPGTGEDAVELLENGLWIDVGDGDGIEDFATRAYLYEYETRSPIPLNIPNEIQLNPTPERTPGGTGGNGYMAVREVHNGEAPVSGNKGAVELLIRGGVNEVNYQTAVLNLNNINGGAGGGGRFDGDTEFGLNNVPGLTGTDINNFAVRAHGYLVIDEAGQYTFDVNTDDSGELWIYGKTFESVNNGTITPHGSMAFLGDRGAEDTLGVITLERGEYEFEYVMNENGGGAAAELSAAKGAHTVFNALDFRLVGGDPTGFDYPGGVTPVIKQAFQITEVLVQPHGSNPLTTLAQARALLQEGDGDDTRDAGTANVINHSDPDNYPARSAGRFANDQVFLIDDGLGFDDDDFVLNAKATVVIETAGDYTFGFDSDDGAQLILEGAQFTSAFGAAVVTNSGTALTADFLTGSSLSGVWTHLEPGEYDLEFLMWERGGGAFAELFVAPGRAPVFSTEFFSLLSTTSRVVPARHVSGAIQLGDGIVEPEMLPGDTDLDGDVDIVDLNNVRNQFGESGQEVLGDADGSGVVDVLDLNLVRAHFGTRNVGNAAVPEPGSWWLLAIGCWSAIAFRRRVVAG